MVPKTPDSRECREPGLFCSSSQDGAGHVRCWPKADTPSCTEHVRYWGVKRTSERSTAPSAVADSAHFSTPGRSPFMRTQPPLTTSLHTRPKYFRGSFSVRTTSSYPKM